MKEKIARFMQGRYGVDSLNKALLGLAFLTMFLSIFVQRNFFYWISILAIILTYFRMFSRNYQKRSHENQIYMKLTSKIRLFFYDLNTKLRNKRKYHIYKCPSCGQKLRIPRGKGKIAIRCRSCGHEFFKRS